MSHRGTRTTCTAGPRASARTWLGRSTAIVLVAALSACAWPGQGQGPEPAAAPQVSQGVADPTASPDPASADPSPSTPADPTPSAVAPSDPTPSTPSAADVPAADPTDAPTGAAADTPSADPSRAAARPVPAEPTDPPQPEYVERGSSGPEVLALQQRLRELGYGLVDPDGHYGSGTQQAVWAFQKAAGLRRDGVIGPKTQDALDAGYRPSPRSSSGHVVEIDLDRQILMAVDDGQVTKVINASSGSGQKFEAKGRQYVAHTPRGTFHVYMQDDGMHASTLELGDMWRPKYFSGGIAVHGSGSIPTHPASHGCVRVSDGAMNWLWDSWGMPIGTTVLVY
ncbi:peptidoglycan-binding protein [Xylanimonas sp. McL0601]|uniref:L,D-transpeptidase family protein n=1 Tax=Xylanimonas sp. McL0601 TaxID=3414739 RepID=UPI003CFAB61E